MFTSDTKRHFIISGIIYSITTIFLYFFAKIYTHYSYGESSAYMNNMYLIMLFGGFINLLIQLALINFKHYFKAAHNLYNSGLACIISGMLIKGIINISGRYTEVHIIYFEAGIFFLVLSFAAMIVTILQLHYHMRSFTHKKTHPH